MSEDAKRASTESLRNAATAAPGEKVASLESADGAESVRAYDEDEIAHTVPCSCFAWSRERVRLCLCGCTSASIVLVVRLLLDWHSGTTYVIHSFIVFFDMVLIHVFTCSPWLSASGEVVTYLAVLAFYITKHRIFELMETVMIAALCSIHLIACCPGILRAAGHTTRRRRRSVRRRRRASSPRRRPIRSLRRRRGGAGGRTSTTTSWTGRRA